VGCAGLVGWSGLLGSLRFGELVVKVVGLGCWLG
jgi:hypothetical protein